MKKKTLIIILSSIICALVFPLINAVDWLKESIRLFNELGVYSLKNLIIKDSMTITLIGLSILALMLALILTIKKDISTLFNSTIGEKLAKSRECKRQKQLEKARKKLQDLEKKDSD